MNLNNGATLTSAKTAKRRRLAIRRKKADELVAGQGGSCLEKGVDFQREDVCSSSIGAERKEKNEEDHLPPAEAMPDPNCESDSR